MISVNRRTLYGEVFNDVRCLSSDEKPTEGIKNGSTLIEIDTGKRYLYDALSGSWNEFSQGGGGGGEYVLPTMSPTTKGGATVGEGLTMSGDSLSVDYSKVASKQSLDDSTKVDPDGGIKRTSNGLSVDFTEVASVDALEEATALSPTGGIVSTQDGLAISPTQQSTGAIDGALLELTAKSKPATQATTDDPPSPSPDYPQPIVTVRGRNLLQNSEHVDFTQSTFSQSTATVNASDVYDGEEMVVTNNTTNQIRIDCENLVAGETYTLSFYATRGTYQPISIFFAYGSDEISNTGQLAINGEWNRISITFVARSEQYLYVTTRVAGGVYYRKVQLTLGSTPQPYVPYGYVGLERRDSQGTLLDTTPIPLPSRGWVAGLPDGTADGLSVDGAGKVVWELADAEVMLDGSETWEISGTRYSTNAINSLVRKATAGNIVMPTLASAFVVHSTDDVATTDNSFGISTSGALLFRMDSDASDASVFTAWLSTHHVTVLYPLATPVTETCGYIDLPDMQDCVLSIPELDALGVRYTIGDGAEIARQWYQRAMLEIDKTALDGRVTVMERRLDARGTVYGFHVDSNESDSTACVTYLADALDMAPAHMDYAGQRFDYGSWGDAFFMPKPCMLKYDGTVDYYLDPNDYSKKLDGTASDVADPTYAGNAMMEWGRDGKIIWYKVVPDADPTSYSVYIADNQVDDAYVCYPFVNGDGDIVKHFYTPCYFGSIVNDGTKDVLRSLSGQLGSTRCKSKTAAVERTMAKANNPEGIDIWDTEVYADVILVNLLLTLISKSLDSQTAFGQGLHTSGTDAINDGFTSGVHDTKGLFWGTNSGDAATYANAVKVFGMENWWGFMWRRFAGLVNVNGTEKYKLTRGTQDGSTANDYVVSTTGSAYDGYLTGGTLPSASGSYIKKQELRPDGSYTPTVVGGSASTYYRDALWTNLNAVTFAYRGGYSYNGALVGAWSLSLYDAASIAYWNFGAAPSCKPQSPEAALASRIKKLEQAVAELVAG